MSKKEESISGNFESLVRDKNLKEKPFKHQCAKTFKCIFLQLQNTETIEKKLERS